jgi:hypothetical protein
MKEIPLTKGAVAIVDDEDFGALNGRRWYLTRQGYAARGGGQRNGVRWPVEMMHRVVLAAPDASHVDHKNGIKTDNRRDNLRLCTRAENARNRKPANGRRFKGTARAPSGRYQAHLRINGRLAYLGTFDSEEDAARAWDDAARQHHGEFTRLNFPEEHQQSDAA